MRTLLHTLLRILFRTCLPDAFLRKHTIGLFPGVGLVLVAVVWLFSDASVFIIGNLPAPSYSTVPFKTETVCK